MSEQKVKNIPEEKVKECKDMYKRWIKDCSLSNPNSYNSQYECNDFLNSIDEYCYEKNIFQKLLTSFKKNDTK
jgi:hypothetical protein